ncbi:hypothetical protein shim_02580 [Shimia sp. SK013]|nr:hypothetical protein shim_02580 [Shimia sp. SK013]
MGLKRKSEFCQDAVRIALRNRLEKLCRLRPKNGLMRTWAA